jgi:hypothetical protein
MCHKINLETFTRYSVTLHNSYTNLQNTQNIQKIYLKYMHGLWPHQPANSFRLVIQQNKYISYDKM